LSDSIDDIDAKILHLLQNNAGLSVAEISEQVGLSSSPCWRRIKRMEEIGIIENRVTILNRTKLGLDFEVFVVVKLVLANIDLISDVQSHIVLRQSKDTNAIPLNLISNSVPRI